MIQWWVSEFQGNCWHASVFQNSSHAFGCVWVWESHQSCQSQGWGLTRHTRKRHGLDSFFLTKVKNLGLFWPPSSRESPFIWVSKRCACWGRIRQQRGNFGEKQLRGFLSCRVSDRRNLVKFDDLLLWSGTWNYPGCFRSACVVPSLDTVWQHCGPEN